MKAGRKGEDDVGTRVLLTKVVVVVVVVVLVVW